MPQGIWRSERINISLRKTQFKTHIDKVLMEGTVSQIFDIGLSFCFIKIENSVSKIHQNLSVFLHKIITRT